MKKIIKVLFMIIVVLFLSLYISKYTNSYYDNKMIMTDEAIKRFENDLKSGKEIKSSNYLPKEKDYNNKISKIGMQTSNFIEKSFKKILNYSIKYLESENN